MATCLHASAGIGLAVHAGPRPLIGIPVRGGAGWFLGQALAVVRLVARLAGEAVGGAARVLAGGAVRRAGVALVRLDPVPRLAALAAAGSERTWGGCVRGPGTTEATLMFAQQAKRALLQKARWRRQPCWSPYGTHREFLQRAHPLVQPASTPATGAEREEGCGW